MRESEADRRGVSAGISFKFGIDRASSSETEPAAPVAR
jgi:hypothetical protein